ncbi:MAG: oligosaccharide flippase family protein [Acidobacteriota bacterium]|nr:oligosaccharide flippase family protein [Acidobacteriota bacterium]
MSAQIVQSAAPPGPMAEDVSGPVVSGRVARDLVSGTTALGLAVVIERGFGFLANLLAARIGGAATFGAYSLAITTANNVSTYAAGGIGSTAIRFSGRYPRESAGYATLTRVLLIVSVVSACLGALCLWAGAGPIAALLGKRSLTTLLQWTALSAAGMILLECCRGFLVGQRRIAAILLLSLTVGLGMITLIPLMARVGPVSMICSQGSITAGAVLICIAFFRPLGLGPSRGAGQSEPLGPMLRAVWSFGGVQLAGLIGLNAAGWWLTSLVARADTTMSQMGFFAIASQLRNIASLAPGLLTESSLAVMAQGEDDVEKTPDRVMAICTFATTFASLLVAGIGIVIVPWLLPLLYGKSYAAASAATAIALATAVIHMGSGPASARMSIVSIRVTGVINTIWAVVVAVAATVFLLSGGNAWKGALIYFGAHILSAGLLLRGLSQRNCVPQGMKSIYAIGGASTILLLLASAARSFHPELAVALSSLMLVTLLLSLAMLVAVAKRHRWVPSIQLLRGFLQQRGLWMGKAFDAPNSGGFDA